MITRPMLSGKLKKKTEYTYPLGATLKFDGIRCIIENGSALSRTFKPIPNKFIQSKLKDLPRGLDGELICRNKSFNESQSAIMRFDGEPDFDFCVFDYVKDSLEKPYLDRIKDLKELVLPSFCIIVEPEILENHEEVVDYEAFALENNYEGIMVRSLDGPYKLGRSTENEGYLLKLKRFEDSEAEVIGFEEEMENQNESTTSELGLTKRGKKQEFMTPKGTLGKFIVREIGEVPWKGQEFRIGTGQGLTKSLRQEVWDNKAKYLGQMITYTYQPHGMKDLPRIPIFKGFRDERDY